MTTKFQKCSKCGLPKMEVPHDAPDDDHAICWDCTDQTIAKHSFATEFLDVPEEFKLELSEAIKALIPKAREFIATNDLISCVSVILDADTKIIFTDTDDEELWEAFNSYTERLKIYEDGMYLEAFNKHDSGVYCEYELEES